MSGYIRQDTTDQISPDSEITAEPLDNEYDAIQAAFSSATGHRHNGQIGEGAPIEVVGPNLDVTFSSNSMSPKITAVYDLGTTNYRFRNAYFSGSLSVPNMTSATVTITGGTITGITDLAIADGGTGASTPEGARDNLGLGTIATQNANAVSLTGGSINSVPVGSTTASTGRFTTLESTGGTSVQGTLVVGGTTTLTGAVSAPAGVSGNASSATKLRDIRTFSLSGGATGSATFDGTQNPNIVVTVPPLGHTHAISEITGTGNMVLQNSNNVSITGGSVSNLTIGGSNISGGSVTGIVDLAIADGGTGASTAPQALVNLGLVVTATELNKLSGLNSTASQIDALVNATAVPAGAILLWAGAANAIPSGWALCNGNNGTPNLQNRFVVGAGASYSVGATGGADSVTLNINQIPNHGHHFDVNTSANGNHNHNYSQGASHAPASASGSNNVWFDNFANINYKNTSDAGNHIHNVAGDTWGAGGGGSHENRPPFYALCYIMKL